MNDGYGIEAAGAADRSPNQPPARYLVIIDAGGSRVARLFLESRTPVAEFDAGSEEIVLMTQGLLPTGAAAGSEWDEALRGHGAAERAAAEVYELDV